MVSFLLNPPPPASSRREIRDVVLVEDNSVDQHLIKAFFHQNFISLRWRDFTNGRAALDACLTEPPDLMLVDLNLPDLDGLQVLNVLRQDGHTFPAIVLTAAPLATLPQSLLHLNVQGYLDKSALTSGLAAAVNGVLDGGLYFSASKPSTRVQSTGKAADKMPRMLLLSEREKEIARLVTHGFSSKQIASRLSLSIRTIENHRARILTRLGLVNVADLVRWCLRNGLG